MKTLLAAGACAIAMGVVGCSAESTPDETGAVDSELRSQLGADEAIRCSVESEETKLALVRLKDGKTALLSLTPAGDLFALGRNHGSLSTSSRGLKFQGPKASLTLGTTLKGKWDRGAQSADVTCAKVTATEAASWRTASALQDYAWGIDGIAEAILEETENEVPKPYRVFVAETSARSSLALGTKVANSGSSLSASSDEDDTALDENDFSYGAMSAAYSLGGGEEYGEWFQAVSDGVSVIDEVRPALGSTAVAGFIAREKVSALSSLVDRPNPSAVEITVGPWTFFLPDAFPQ